MTDEELWLHTICRKNNFVITDIQIRLLSSFKSLLLEWNKKINLVSRKSEENLWKGHISLSVSMLFAVEFRPGMRILDLGTGGGFPGIPLAIMLPECSFVLLDSTQKKIMAVESMIETLSLHNAQTIWGRAEEINRTSGYRDSFDAVVARSVSNLSNLLDWGSPFLKKEKGENRIQEKVCISTPSLITFKGSEIDEEERAAGIKFPDVRLHHVPLLFRGSEDFDHRDKKLTIATPV